jgi:hypothetical protein
LAKGRLQWAFEEALDKSLGKTPLRKPYANKFST